MTGLARSLCDLAQCHRKISAHGATDAAVGKSDGIRFGVANQLCINVDGAKVVDDDRQFKPMIFGHKAVDQAGLSCAKVSADNGDREPSHSRAPSVPVNDPVFGQACMCINPPLKKLRDL